MNDDVKISRINKYKALNFAGTVDWAIDLQSFDANQDVLNDDDETIGDDDDDDDSNLTSRYPLPACTVTYNTMEDFDKNINGAPDNCKTLYTVDTLSRTLKGALKGYDDMMKNGYDGKFKTYAQSVSDNAANSVHDFIYANGNKYFSCTVTEKAVCCDYCKNNKNPANQCRYCFNGKCNAKRESGPGAWDSTGGGGGQPDTPQQKITFANHSEPCPPDFSQRGFGPDNPHMQSVYWHMNDDKADPFYTDLMTATGIAKDETKIDNYDRGVDCAPHNHPGDGDECWDTGMDFSIPVINGYGAGDVANPKDLFNKALQNVTGLDTQLDGVLTDLRAGVYAGNANDLIDSISIPILMIEQSTENMQNVEETADKIDEEKKKAIILGVISAILFIVPAVGEVIGSVAEAADVAAIITTLGVAGNTAMDVYAIVDDPQSAPLAIFSLVMEPSALASVAQISRAANLRRGMSDADVAKLGGKMAGRLATVRKVTGVCRKL